VTIDGLVEDARVAADEARRISGATRVIWLGVRFGALVAARAMAGRDDAAGLVLWEPVHSGADYFRGVLRTLLLSQVAAGSRPDANVDDLMATVEREGHVDVHGYYLHRRVVESARDSKLAESLAPWMGPTLLVQIQGRRRLSSGNAGLVQSLSEKGAVPAVAQVTEEAGWHFVSNPAWRSEPLLRITMEWLDAMA
jgi:hypothetical protein